MEKGWNGAVQVVFLHVSELFSRIKERNLRLCARVKKIIKTPSYKLLKLPRFPSSVGMLPEKSLRPKDLEISEGFKYERIGSMRKGILTRPSRK